MGASENEAEVCDLLPLTSKLAFRVPVGASRAKFVFFTQIFQPFRESFGRFEDAVGDP
jgi:hypothetical protein